MGALTRFFARDVEPGNLFGCDPAPAILEVCERSRIPAALARSEFVPDALPFEHRFDLAYAFSVFTHLSESAHDASLRALHRAIAPGAADRDDQTAGVSAAVRVAAPRTRFARPASGA